MTYFTRIRILLGRFGDPMGRAAGLPSWLEISWKDTASVCYCLDKSPSEFHSVTFHEVRHLTPAVRTACGQSTHYLRAPSLPYFPTPCVVSWSLTHKNYCKPLEVVRCIIRSETLNGETGQAMCGSYRCVSRELEPCNDCRSPDALTLCFEALQVIFNVKVKNDKGAALGYSFRDA